MTAELPDGELETLWDDGEFILSRLKHSAEGGPRLMVRLAGAHPTGASLARLEHAYALRDELEASWAAKPTALIEGHGELALRMEDPGGEVLATLLGKPWNTGPFLRVAVGVAGAMSGLHRRGLVHKDMKPSNILVDVATGKAWLTGFVLTTRLAGERHAPGPPQAIAWTLPYLAPEQTGRRNRSVDARSDLYSLGVTFYEMLTGTLPFRASEPLEWIHCHIARQPVPPGERVLGIPTMLSAIVLKLLAKNAEDRYQTAQGLEADLQQCFSEWDSAARIEPFPLDGREREIAGLVDAFEPVARDGRQAFGNASSGFGTEPLAFHATATTSASVEGLDLATVMKASQTISGEILIDRLVETLMVTALQHAGAERGLLIVRRGDEARVEAEAATQLDAIVVRRLGAAAGRSELPDTVLNYVLRTQEVVLLDDAGVHNSFSSDGYVVEHRVRSMLCLPLVKQATLVGVLYLENNVASHVFTPARLALLKVLASQAATSLENARLYADLHEAQAYLAEAQRLSATGSFGWKPSTGEIVWSEETHRIFALYRSTRPTVDVILSRTHPE